MRVVRHIPRRHQADYKGPCQTITRALLLELAQIDSKSGHWESHHYPCDPVLSYKPEERRADKPFIDITNTRSTALQPIDGHRIYITEGWFVFVSLGPKTPAEALVEFELADPDSITKLLSEVRKAINDNQYWVRRFYDKSQTQTI